MKEKGVYMGLGSVEDPDPGSGIGCFLTPGSGIWGWVKNQDPQHWGLGYEIGILYQGF
jgi:hypothetical protein